jgi:hypothetical protein
MLIMPALRKLRIDDCGVEASLSYIDPAPPKINNYFGNL